MIDKNYFEVFRDERKFFKTSLYSVGSFFAQKIEPRAKQIKATELDNKTIRIALLLKNNKRYAIEIVKNYRNGYTYSINGKVVGGVNNFIEIMKNELGIGGNS